MIVNFPFHVLRCEQFLRNKSLFFSLHCSTFRTEISSMDVREFTSLPRKIAPRKGDQVEARVEREDGVALRGEKTLNI
jgi:hypothetical protein